MVVDVGTGDGRAVLARARAEPCDLALGVDASATAMAESSRRADGRGPANAVFLAAGAEGLAETVLAGQADLVTVTFPWGSLLRGVLDLDPATLRGVAALVAPGGRIEVLASVVPSDGVAGIELLDAAWERAICRAWATVGLELVSMRPASAAEIAASGSSWARRLVAGGEDRPVWRIDACRPGSPM